ncbi:hypothetical protein QVD17_31619 [Tagetes erecta]|uniref:Uncharacterized protein n=1 Tax=Tagetes erecta TaxID=13708 RepID=A0AAD8NPE2_TARER|nr:hypothetical protein QVD17_31619 [Tagetes erecta]
MYLNVLFCKKNVFCFDQVRGCCCFQKGYLIRGAFSAIAKLLLSKAYKAADCLDPFPQAIKNTWLPTLKTHVKHNPDHI